MESAIAYNRLVGFVCLPFLELETSASHILLKCLIAFQFTSPFFYNLVQFGKDLP
jgi:hypothetical protein